MGSESRNEEKPVEREEGTRSLGVPEPEVPAKPQRRRFSAEYKLRIVQAADAATDPGELGALLRREGLYHSHLTTWRRQRDEGALGALGQKKRGRKAKAKNPLSDRVSELEREIRKLRERLEQAQAIIQVQKKISEILGVPLETDENGGAN